MAAALAGCFSFCSLLAPTDAEIKLFPCGGTISGIVGSFQSGGEFGGLRASTAC